MLAWASLNMQQRYPSSCSLECLISASSLTSTNKPLWSKSPSDRPTDPDRSVFFVKFWELEVAWIFLSVIPGAIITVLFYFDQEISSIICTLPRYGTKKAGGFAWDIVLLGITTALCATLGIPPANGLLPQAPLHSESLMHTVKAESITTDEKGERKIQIKEKKKCTNSDGRRSFKPRESSFLSRLPSNTSWA